MSARRKKREYTREEMARREAYDWIHSLISALLICILAFVFVFRLMEVNGNSMLPTLHNGDKLLVSKLFYEPQRGDIVVFKKDSYDSDKDLIKRVIAVEGDVVNIDFAAGVVYVNGEPIEEDYINELTANKLDFIGPQRFRKTACLCWEITGTPRLTAATAASAWSTSV